MGEARRRKALLGEQYGKISTFQSLCNKQSNVVEEFMDGKPYERHHPMFSLLHQSWSKACQLGFKICGRGALIREVATGLGRAGYLPLAKISDPVGKQIIETYDPTQEFIVAEPNDKGGTRWQIFNL